MTKTKNVILFDQIKIKSNQLNKGGYLKAHSNYITNLKTT